MKYSVSNSKLAGKQQQPTESTSHLSTHREEGLADARIQLLLQGTHQTETILPLGRGSEDQRPETQKGRSCQQSMRGSEMMPLAHHDVDFLVYREGEGPSWIPSRALDCKGIDWSRVALSMMLKAVKQVRLQVQS